MSIVTAATNLSPLLNNIGFDEIVFLNRRFVKEENRLAVIDGVLFAALLQFKKKYNNLPHLNCIIAKPSAIEDLVERINEIIMMDLG